jgi:hypothetical protein
MMFFQKLEDTKSLKARISTGQMRKYLRSSLQHCRCFVLHAQTRLLQDHAPRWQLRDSSVVFPEPHSAHECVPGKSFQYELRSLGKWHYQSDRRVFHLGRATVKAGFTYADTSCSRYLEGGIEGFDVVILGVSLGNLSAQAASRATS